MGHSVSLRYCGVSMYFNKRHKKLPLVSVAPSLHLGTRLPSSPSSNTTICQNKDHHIKTTRTASSANFKAASTILTKYQSPKTSTSQSKHLSSPSKNVHFDGDKLIKTDTSSILKTAAALAICPASCIIN